MGLLLTAKRGGEGKGVREREGKGREINIAWPDV